MQGFSFPKGASGVGAFAVETLLASTCFAAFMMTCGLSRIARRVSSLLTRGHSTPLRVVIAV